MTLALVAEEAVVVVVIVVVVVEALQGSLSSNGGAEKGVVIALAGSWTPFILDTGVERAATSRQRVTNKGCGEAGM